MKSPGKHRCSKCKRKSHKLYKRKGMVLCEICMSNSLVFSVRKGGTVFI